MGVCHGVRMPVCLRFQEPEVWELTGMILEEISDTVAAVRSVDPDTLILLSYIPTSGGIYGDLMTESCVDHVGDPGRQREASELLATHAEDLGIGYLRSPYPNFDCSTKRRQSGLTTTTSPWPDMIFMSASPGRKSASGIALCWILSES